MKKLLLFMIQLYQKTLSPDHGWMKFRHPFGFCRFYPTCSEYTRQAISALGVKKGLWLGLKRVVRCNPFSSPTLDPIFKPAKD